MNDIKVKMRKRLVPALLAGVTPSFMFFFFGIFEIFCGNRKEFMFSFGDFGAVTALIALACAALIAALIIFLPKVPAAVVFGVAVWFSVMGYVQSILLNGSGSLSADGGGSASTGFIVFDTALWIVTGVLIVGAALLMSKFELIKPILVIALVMVLVMLVTSSVMQMGNVTDSSSESGDPESAYLTKLGLDQVSEDNNIIIFLIDRFDVKYYNNVVEKDPEFFDGLDGFTYFSDNVSLYSRTYPAVPVMITGVDTDFSTSADEYFMKAYRESPFLNDLKNDGWAVKIYTQNFYCYRSGTPLLGVADNMSISAGYSVKDRGKLVGDMIKLSAYRYFPSALKDSIDISSASFSGIVKLDGDASLYETDDPVVCGQILENGITLDANKKSYNFIHLSGCHSPYSMDENAKASDDSSAERQLRGCMKMIYSYLDDLKELGVYDGATIVITGDHPSAISDSKIPSQPRLTALFVKPSGASGEPLKYSSAQVSDENLIPTLVKSAGIATEGDYGTSYFDVPEGENVTRYHKFELSVKSNEVTEIVTFEVDGDGTDFSNWNIAGYTEIGALYK